MQSTHTSWDVAAPPERAPASVRIGALAGIVGPILFTLGFLAQEAFRRPDYSAVTEPVSALEAGPNGWVQQVNFVVFGVLMLTFVVGLHRGVAPSRGAPSGPSCSVSPPLDRSLPLRFPFARTRRGRFSFRPATSCPVSPSSSVRRWRCWSCRGGWPRTTGSEWRRRTPPSAASRLWSASP